MKKWITLVLATAAIAGCQTQQKPAAKASVLDVSAGPAYQAPAGYQPAAYPPAQASSTYPLPEPMPAAVIETPAPAAMTANYTVKRGDTLYHIARERYGDGKQWQRIAAVNPGVSPTTLRVGQVLTMP